MSLNSPFARRFLAPTIAMGLVLAAVLAGCGSSSPTNNTPPAPTVTTAPAPTSAPTTAPTAAATTPPQSGNVSIAIQNFAFNPQSITVKVGSTVTWTDKDTTAHTVTSVSGPASFNSGPLAAPGGTFKFTFSQAGTYSYHCAIHPFMMATITVVS
jgi:plastocyanin